MTLEAWVYPTGDGTHHEAGGTILCKEMAFEISRFKGGEVNAAFANTRPNWIWIHTNMRAPLNRWSHVAFAYNSGKKALVFYLDGNRRGAARVEGPIHAAPMKLWLAARPTVNAAFQGYLNEVRIWGVALDDQTIQQNLCRRLSGAEPGLVGLWPLNDAADDKARDRTSSENTGVLRGTSWAEPPAESPIRQAIMMARQQRGAHAG